MAILMRFRLRLSISGGPLWYIIQGGFQALLDQTHMASLTLLFLIAGTGGWSGFLAVNYITGLLLHHKARHP